MFWVPEQRPYRTFGRLAASIWNMAVRHVPYNPPGQYLFLAQKKIKLVQKIRNKIAKLDLRWVYYTANRVNCYKFIDKVRILIDGSGYSEYLKDFTCDH